MIDIYNVDVFSYCSVFKHILDSTTICHWIPKRTAHTHTSNVKSRGHVNTSVMQREGTVIVGNFHKFHGFVAVCESFLMARQK